MGIPMLPIASLGQLAAQNNPADRFNRTAQMASQGMLRAMQDQAMKQNLAQQKAMFPQHQAMVNQQIMALEAKQRLQQQQAQAIKQKIGILGQSFPTQPNSVPPQNGSGMTQAVNPGQPSFAPPKNGQSGLNSLDKMNVVRSLLGVKQITPELQYKMQQQGLNNFKNMPTDVRDHIDELGRRINKSAKQVQDIYAHGGSIQQYAKDHGIDLNNQSSAYLPTTAMKTEMQKQKSSTASLDLMAPTLAKYSSEILPFNVEGYSPEQITSGIRAWVKKNPKNTEKAARFAVIGAAQIEQAMMRQKGFMGTRSQRLVNAIKNSTGSIKTLWKGLPPPVIAKAQYYLNKYQDMVTDANTLTISNPNLTRQQVVERIRKKYSQGKNPLLLNDKGWQGVINQSASSMPAFKGKTQNDFKAWYKSLTPAQRQAYRKKEGA